ncbi:MAG: hypothetical protein L6Q92_09790 [Phycisphaerae bacterium]|nr:hypothetical protein [Phycisphaerae bacterium]
MLGTVRRYWVHTKLTLVAALALAILIVIIANRGHRTDVWLFHRFEQVPVLWLMAVTAAASIAMFWALTRLRGLLAEARRIRTADEEARRAAEHRAMSEELKEREKRIDEKLRQALHAPEPSDGKNP